jgi:uncharacterized membrane protein
MKALKLLKENYLLAAILFLAALLRFYHLDTQSLWLDEVHTMKVTNPELSYKEFSQLIFHKEGMGQFYFFMVRTLNGIFGYTGYTARFFSAIIGVLTVYSIYVLGRTIFNKNVGLIASTLLCVNWFGIFYSQEARPYILLMLFIIISYIRIIVFLKNQTYKNAILYGIAVALSFNAHTVGLITVFSQFVLLFFIFCITDKEKKLLFFKHGLTLFATATVFSIPMFSMFKKMTQYKSGWLQLPGPDGFTEIFHQFLGNTELLYFIFTTIIIFYLIQLFNQKEEKLSADNVINNKLILSGLVLFSSFFLPILLPIIKSYTSEPMILHRYFTALLPAIVLTIAIGIDLIKNAVLKVMLILVILAFSLTDIFLVKDYYNRVIKTQFREVTDFIIEKNTNKDKVVSTYGWVMGYFFEKDKTNKPNVQSPFSAYVNSMRNQAVSLESFWYMDGNSLPYNLPPEDEQFLNEHFTTDLSIDKLDVWAKHYTLKGGVSNSQAGLENFGIKDFNPKTQDNIGNMILFENGTVISGGTNMTKGNYKLIINGNSLPEKPIDGQNAHLKIRMNGTSLGEFNLSENKNNQTNEIKFSIDSDQSVRFQITFDNDFSKDGQDRNVIIYSIKLVKE